MSISNSGTRQSDNQLPFGGLQTRRGQDRLDRFQCAIDTDLCGQEPFEPFGGRRQAGAAPQGRRAQALGEAVDLDGGEVGEHRGPLQAFLMWTERPSAVTA